MTPDLNSLPTHLETPLLQRALDSSPIPFAIAGPDGRLTAFNRALHLWSGHAPDELVDCRLVDLVDQDERESVDGFLKNCRETVSFELMPNVAFRKKTGVVARTLLFGTPIRSSAGDLDGMTLQILDIEEPAQAFDRLESADEFHQLMVDASPDLIFVKDEEFRIVRANLAFLGLYPEQTRDEILGTTTVESYQPEDAQAFLEQDRIAFDEGRSEIDERILLPDGRDRLLHTTKVRFEDGEGQRFILCTARDVTEREELIEQLRQSNADLDQFAYVASHDLRSPLQAIAKIANWIEEDCVDLLPEESKKHFGLLKSRVGRLDRLLEDILIYSRVGRHDDPPESIDLQRTIEDIGRLVDLPSGFRVEAPSVSLLLPRTALELILRNVISNSIKHHHLDEGLITVDVTRAERSNRMTITDDGPGIPPQYHAKAMHMFETLRPRDEVEGSGMGLALARRAAMSFGGSLSIDPDCQRGTRIVLDWTTPTTPAKKTDEPR